MPVSLTIYAILLLVIGVLAAVDIVEGARNGEIRMNLAVVCLPIGIGIVRRRNVWRKVAVLFAVLSCGFVCAVCTLLFLLRAQPEIVIGGHRIQNAGPEWCLAFNGVAVVLLLIQSWILVRRPARDAMVSKTRR